MGNRKASSSMANFVKERLKEGWTKEQLVTGIEDGIASGIFSSKQKAVPIVRWYLNYFKKKLVVKPQTEE